MTTTISSKKMVELIRRLTLGTEQDIVVWKATDSENVESYDTTVSETSIVIEGSKQARDVSLVVFDTNGRVLASLGTEKSADSDEKMALERLFNAVRLKSGGIDRYIDGVLGQLPEDSLRSF